jgi:hypothetical protein
MRQLRSLRALNALADHLGSVSSTHIMAETVCKSSSRNLCRPPPPPAQYQVHIHTCRQNTHTHEIKIEINNFLKNETET